LAIFLGFFATGSVARAQSFPPAWSSNATYAAGDLVVEGGNIYRAIKPVISHIANPAVNYTDWQLNQVQSNTTLMVGVGQVFPDLATAWTYALYCRVSDGVYLHFYISTNNGNFSESFSAPFLLDHGSGARIAILGDLTSHITFSFSGTNGMIIDTGHSLNTLSAVTLQSTAGNTVIGIKADGNASIAAVSDTVITGFNTCVQATNNASVTLTSTMNMLGFSHDALDAEDLGSIVFNGGSIFGPGANTQATGLFSTSGGEIKAIGSVINACQQGALASEGGRIDLISGTVSGCGFGIIATYGGSIDFNGGAATSCGIGVDASERGYIDISDGSATGNLIYDLTCSAGGYITAASASYVTTHQDGAVNGAFITQ
jgi:hypothetical protein